MNYSDEFNKIFESINNEKELSPPFECKGNIIKDFKERSQKYINVMKELAKSSDITVLKGINNNIRSIEALSINISETLIHYLNGDIHKAYQTFQRSIEKTRIKEHLENTSIPLSNLCNSSSHLYRVRKSDTPLKGRMDMFHIPFSKRHLVSAQRYSVSGLPCLYLGSSILVCWQEMGKPDFDKLYISAFEAVSDASNIKILDLAFTLNSTLRKKPFNFFKDETDEDIINRKISNLTIWPLVLACNYIKENNGNFNVEYIIPNLLMQWVSNSDGVNIQGISYKTTKLLNQRDSDIGINIIIPPNKNSIADEDKEHCQNLSSTFKITNPVSWQVFNTLAPYPALKSEKKSIFSLEGKNNIENFDEHLVDSYPDTEFYKIERLITKLMRFDFI